MRRHTPSFPPPAFGTRGGMASRIRTHAGRQLAVQKWAIHAFGIFDSGFKNVSRSWKSTTQRRSPCRHLVAATASAKHTAKRRLVVREKAYDSTLSPLFGCFQCFCPSRWLACAAGLENITASPPPLLTSTQRTPTFSLLLHHFRCRPRLPFQPREIQLPPKALRKFLPLLT